MIETLFRRMSEMLSLLSVVRIVELSLHSDAVSDRMCMFLRLTPADVRCSPANGIKAESYETTRQHVKSDNRLGTICAMDIRGIS